MTSVNSNSVSLTAEDKRKIAQEVKTQIEAAAQGQQSAAPPSAEPQIAAPRGTEPTPSTEPAIVAQPRTPPPALDPAHRVFVVDTDITVVTKGGECALSQGDVITRVTDVPDADNLVKASISASKKSDCPAGETVVLQVDDLQEMYNHFEEAINEGLAELAKKQGTGGMPKNPSLGTRPSDVPPRN